MTKIEIEKPNSYIANITVEEALAAIEKAVEIRGRDFVYGDEERVHIDDDPDNEHLVCVYTRTVGDEVKGSCIVGTALIDILGVDPKLLEGVYAASHVVMDKLGVRNYAAREVFSKAQIHQDNRETWGESYDAAKRYADHVGH
jgi:hypothetical protein